MLKFKHARCFEADKMRLLSYLLIMRSAHWRKPASLLAWAMHAARSENTNAGNWADFGCLCCWEGLGGLEVQTLQCSSAFQPRMRIWVWDHLAAPPRLCCTSGRQILLAGGLFFFFPQLYLLLVFRTKQIKLNHDRKICWASGINSGFHFAGSHSCPQHRHWEGAGMLL